MKQTTTKKKSSNVKKSTPKPTTSEYIDVKDSKIHMTGVFAKKDIPKDAKIIEYVGEKITKAETDRRGEVQLQKSNGHADDGGVYIFELNKRHDIDGNVKWNTARFLNHSCNPNCETNIIRGHIWILASRNIKKGEELCYNYGYDVDNYYEHPCKCGSKNCVGYIVAEKHIPKLKRKLAAAKKKAKKKVKKEAVKKKGC